MSNAADADALTEQTGTVTEVEDLELYVEDDEVQSFFRDVEVRSASRPPGLRPRCALTRTPTRQVEYASLAATARSLRARLETAPPRTPVYRAGLNARNAVRRAAAAQARVLADAALALRE